MEGCPDCILLLCFFCYDSLPNVGIKLMLFTFFAGVFTSLDFFFAISGDCDLQSRILFSMRATPQHHYTLLRFELNVGLTISCL